jgi:hypothetical protein
VTSSELAILADATPAVKRAVAYWSVPARMAAAAQSYINDGQVDVPAVAFAAARLEMLHVDPLENLPDTFVIYDDKKGTFSFGMYATLQRALIERVGYRIDFKELADDHVIGVMVFPDKSESSPLRIDGQLGDIKKYAAKNKRNYDDKPRRMYEARCSTELISLYASGALRSIVTGAGIIDYTEGEPSGNGTESSPAATSPEGSLQVPARSVAPSGATIPEHLREPEVDPGVRARLLERVAGLTGEQLDALGGIVHPAKVPNLRSARFTAAHGLLLDRLISEVELRIPGPVPREGPPPSGDAPQPASAGVHGTGDDQPPLSAYPEAQYTPTDPGRPF